MAEMMLPYVDPYLVEDDFEIDSWTWTPAADETLSQNMACAAREAVEALSQSHMHFNCNRGDELPALTVGLGGPSDCGVMWLHFDVAQVFRSAAQIACVQPDRSFDEDFDMIEGALKASLEEVKKIRKAHAL